MKGPANPEEKSRTLIPDSGAAGATGVGTMVDRKALRSEDAGVIKRWRTGDNMASVSFEGCCWLCCAR